jgi:hypothetical protein
VMTDLPFAATAIPANQLIRAAAISQARVLGRAARGVAGLWRRATDFAVDAALVARAAVPIAYALGWTARAVQAALGAGTTCAVTARGRTGTGAKDAGQVARTPATVAVDAAAI